MINAIWLFMILAGVLVAAAKGDIAVVTSSAVTSARQAVDTVLSFMGIIVLWMGLARIAQESGLMVQLARLLEPAMRLMFPSIPRNHPAIGAMMLNISANMLGLGQAATPLGLKAMEELQKLNRRPDTATEAMCTFLALNTSGLTLVPVTMVAWRAAKGSANPAEIVGTSLFATAFSTLVALSADYLFRRLSRRNSGG